MISYHPNFIPHKRKEIKERVARLAAKLVWTTNEIRRLGGFRLIRNQNGPRGGMIRHWVKMYRVSLRATRKKIYRLEEELKNL